MNETEKNEIIQFFKNMQDRYSFEYMLQRCFNHSLHFVTTPIEYDLCTEEVLAPIIHAANSKKEGEKITVFGKKHTNFHFSYSFYDRLKNKIGTEVRDTYISIKLPNSTRYYHILISPPETRHPYLNYMFNSLYKIPEYLIYPIPSGLP